MPRHRSHSHHSSAAPSPQHWVTPYYWAKHQAPYAEGLHKGMSADEAFVIIHGVSSHKNVHRAAMAEFSSYRYHTEKDANYANYLERKQGAAGVVPSPAVRVSPPFDFVALWFVLFLFVVIGLARIGFAVTAVREGGGNSSTLSPSAQREIWKIDRERERVESATAAMRSRTTMLNRDSQKAIDSALRDAPRLERK